MIILRAILQGIVDTILLPVTLLQCISIFSIRVRGIWAKLTQDARIRAMLNRK